MTDKEIIARRVASELKDGDRVNLDIGLPTLVAKFLTAGLRVYFHSWNGIFGRALCRAKASKRVLGSAAQSGGTAYGGKRTAIRCT